MSVRTIDVYFYAQNQRYTVLRSRLRNVKVAFEQSIFLYEGNNQQRRLRKKRIDIEWRLLPSIHCYVSLRIRFYLVDRINMHNILLGITWKSSSNQYFQDKLEDSQNVNRIKNK